MTKILNFYIAKRFVKIFLSVVISLLTILFIGSFLNNIKLAHSTKSNLEVLVATLYELPFFFQIALPFGMVLVALIFIRYSSSTNELDIMKTSGVSIWHIIKIIAPLIMLIGFLIVFVLSPFVSYLKNKGSPILNTSIATTEDSFWIIDKQPEQQIIIKAKDTKIHNRQIYLYNVIIFQITAGKYHMRIDGISSIIDAGKLIIYNASIKDKTHMFPQNVETVVLNTNITPKNLQNLALDPESVTIWHLPKFIANLEHLGLNSIDYKLYWYNLLTYPFTLFAMFLIGVGLALSKEKRVNNLQIIFIGVTAGFVLYFFTKMIHSFGASGLIPPLFTILGGLSLILCCGTYLIINNEGV